MDCYSMLHACWSCLKRDLLTRCCGVIHKISKAPTLWLILAIFRPFTDVFKSQSHCHAHKLHSMVVLPHHGLNPRKRVIACHISLLILFFKFVSTWISGSTREEVEESFHSNTKWHFVMEGICHFSKHLKRQANVLLTAMVSFPLQLIKMGLSSWAFSFFGEIQKLIWQSKADCKKQRHAWNIKRHIL